MRRAIEHPLRLLNWQIFLLSKCLTNFLYNASYLTNDRDIRFYCVIFNPTFLFHIVVTIQEQNFSIPPGLPFLYFADSESIVASIPIAAEHPWPVLYTSLSTRGSQLTNCRASLRGAQLWREHPWDLKSNIKPTVSRGFKLYASKR